MNPPLSSMPPGLYSPPAQQIAEPLPDFALPACKLDDVEPSRKAGKTPGRFRALKNTLKKGYKIVKNGLYWTKARSSAKAQTKPSPVTRRLNTSPQLHYHNANVNALVNKYLRNDNEESENGLLSPLSGGHLIQQRMNGGNLVRGGRAPIGFEELERVSVLTEHFNMASPLLLVEYSSPRFVPTQTI